MGKLYDSVLTTVGEDEWHTSDKLRTKGKEGGSEKQWIEMEDSRMHV